MALDAFQPLLVILQLHGLFTQRANEYLKQFLADSHKRTLVYHGPTVGQDCILQADFQSARLPLMRDFTVFQPLFHVATYTKRRLPHLHEIECPIFITWRLHGSLPRNRVFPADTTAGKAFAVMDSILDRATNGPLYLGRADIATLIVDAIRYGEEQMKYYGFTLLS